ncbi:hypothetical protein RZE82_05330 [Mollicutes bacterium LVI A0039]|nr:hypothetical protein RZE82_05330 [Mollicutes bacterium LVI A0039]
MKQPKFRGWLILALVSFTMTVLFGLGVVLAGSKSIIRMSEDTAFRWMTEDQLGDDFMQDFMGEDFTFDVSENKHGDGFKLNLENGENSVTFDF